MKLTSGALDLLNDCLMVIVWILLTTLIAVALGPHLWLGGIDMAAILVLISEKKVLQIVLYWPTVVGGMIAIHLMGIPTRLLFWSLAISFVLRAAYLVHWLSQ